MIYLICRRAFNPGNVTRRKLCEREECRVEQHRRNVVKSANERQRRALLAADVARGIA